MDKINLIKQINDAVADMGSKVEFINEKRQHRYQVRATGEWLQGVSSVSSIVPKDWLAPWGAKEAVKFLGYSDYEGDTERANEMLDKIRACTPETFIKLLAEAKGASGRKSKQSLIDGKKGHAWLEDFVKAKVALLKLTPVSQFKAKDIFRASSLSLLGVSNSHVAKDQQKIESGRAISPLLLVRDSTQGRVIIADGYHRLCAIYFFNEDAVIPCKIV